MSETEENMMVASNSTTESQESKENTSKPDRPDLVEIGDAFDGLDINPVLKTIAETNELTISWEQLQPILESLLSQQSKMMEERFTDEAYRKNAEDQALKIRHSISDHLSCPFTIQRLCELVIEPKKYYKMYIKYLRAVEKVLLVTSYWEDYAHLNDKEEPMEEDTVDVMTGETLLPAFINCIELEPHNFEVAPSQMEESTEEPKEKEESKESLEKEEKKEKEVKEAKEDQLTHVDDTTDSTNESIETEKDVIDSSVQNSDDVETTTTTTSTTMTTTTTTVTTTTTSNESDETQQEEPSSMELD